MRKLLKILFGAILLSMLYVTTTAMMERGVFEAGAALWPDAWFRATLADAYFGFVTFFVWVAYKERRAAAKVIWFILIMSLGNIAMSVYMLIQLSRLKPGDSWESLLLRQPTA